MRAFFEIYQNLCFTKTEEQMQSFRYANTSNRLYLVIVKVVAGVNFGQFVFLKTIYIIDPNFSILKLTIWKEKIIEVKTHHG